MPKVCTACGLTVEKPKKSPEEAEDCPNCGELEGAVAQEEVENNIEEEEEA